MSILKENFVRKLMVSLAASTLLLAACGGDDSSAPDTAAPESESEAEVEDSASDGGGDSQEAESDTADPPPAGPVEVNTIRIGSQVWSRTLPMTTGQCVVFEDDGTLPDSGFAWGTLDGDDDIRFSANYGQDGTFESEVVDENEFFWIAGPRSPGPDDLVIELDFDALTISGSGSFANAFNSDVEQGSFVFQCEPEDG